MLIKAVLLSGVPLFFDKGAYGLMDLMGLIRLKSQKTGLIGADN